MIHMGGGFVPYLSTGLNPVEQQCVASEVGLFQHANFVQYSGGVIITPWSSIFYFSKTTQEGERKVKYTTPSTFYNNFCKTIQHHSSIHHTDLIILFSRNPLKSPHIIPLYPAKTFHLEKSRLYSFLTW